MIVTESAPRDGNRVPILTLDGFMTSQVSPSAFAGGTTNARGNDGGTSDPLTLFTVTGDVLVRIFGVCTVSLTGATATLQVGVASNTAALIALTTATDIDAGQIWLDSTPSVGDSLANLPGSFIIVNSANIIETVATADITAGNVYYNCLWRPLSPDGNIVPAV